MHFTHADGSLTSPCIAILGTPTCPLGYYNQLTGDGIWSSSSLLPSELPLPGTINPILAGLGLDTRDPSSGAGGGPTQDLLVAAHRNVWISDGHVACGIVHCSAQTMP